MRKMTKRGIVSSSSNIKRPKNVKRKKRLAMAGDFVLERERDFSLNFRQIRLSEFVRTEAKLLYTSRPTREFRF